LLGLEGSTAWFDLAAPAGAIVVLSLIFISFRGPKAQADCETRPRHPANMSFFVFNDLAGVWGSQRAMRLDFVLADAM
jgi:hypothetical protein